MDYQKAMHYFTQAADAGNAMAMAYLGKVKRYCFKIKHKKLLSYWLEALQLHKTTECFQAL